MQMVLAQYFITASDRALEIGDRKKWQGIAKRRYFKQKLNDNNLLSIYVNANGKAEN